MNGIKLIREKSNISRSSLAERMGVTRQTVTLWEKGVRKPATSHMAWLCDFYGLSEKWFGELTEDDYSELLQKPLYLHKENEKQFYTFVPNESEKYPFSFGELDSMLDEKYANALKRSKGILNRVERFMHIENEEDAYLIDRIITAERGISDIDIFLNLMSTVEKTGVVGRRFLKVPLRYEIKAALYAMMIATGHYSIEELKSLYPNDFYKDEFSMGVDQDYLANLSDLMKDHWTERRNRQLEKMEQLRNRNKVKNNLS